MKFGKILVSIYQPGSAAILNSIPGLEVIEGLGYTQYKNRQRYHQKNNLNLMQTIFTQIISATFAIVFIYN